MKIKVCDRYNYAQICSSDGAVRLCSWVVPTIELGSLLDHNMEELWQSEKARAFRKSLRDGSFQYCVGNKERCPYLSNGTMEQHLIEIDPENEPKLPQNIALGYEYDCNYRCVTCGLCINEINKEQKGNLGKIEERLVPVLGQAKIVSANGMGEVFASPSTLKLLHDWKPEHPADEITAILETNGSLFDEKHWERISNLGQYNLEVGVTVMSFEESTYHYLSGTSLPISRLINNLKFIKKLREQNLINYFELGTVVQEANFRALPEFTRRCIEEFGADCVRLRPFFPYSPQPKYVEWFMDVRNPYHPNHREYLEVMKHPIFSHPKVFKWSGELESQIGPFVDFVSKNVTDLSWMKSIRQRIAKGIDNICVSARASKEYLKTRVNQLIDLGACQCESDAVCEEFEKNREELKAALGAEDCDKLFRAFRQRADMQYVDDGIRAMREQYPYIVIMGAGNYGKRLAQQFFNCGIDFDGFVVSDDRNPPKEVIGKPVWRLNDIPFDKEKTGVVVAVYWRHYGELRDNLESKGLNYIYPFAVY